MTAPLVLGVDPGGTTGFVIRRDAELVSHATVVGLTGLHDALTGLDFQAVPDLIAIEEVTAPVGFANGRREFISPGSLIPTALAAGYVKGFFAAAYSYVAVVWVPPAHNGQGHLSAYPEELRPTRGQGKGHDRLRHCRSAWDVAGTAALMVTRSGHGWEECQ